MLDKVIVTTEGLLAPMALAVVAWVPLRDVIRLRGDVTLEGIQSCESGTTDTAVWLTGSVVRIKKPYAVDPLSVFF